MSDNNNSVSHQTIELLTRCLQLQSEKDGIQRPTPDKALVGVPVDDFTRDPSGLPVRLDNRQPAGPAKPTG